MASDPKSNSEMSDSEFVRIAVADLETVVARLFIGAGLAETGARRIAAALVEADVEGLSSHGVLQGLIYLKRLRAGTMSPAESAKIVHERDAIAVLDADHMLGHLSAEQAMALAVDKARQFGIAAVAVRNASHFGVAGRYARQAADLDCIGVVMCNARPNMPAPGGAEKLVGTNPLAISVPMPEAPHMVFDMATSAGTAGRVRYANSINAPLPDGWAVTADGVPTNDAAEAMAGMMLPAAGPKGFGLSLMIDLLSGLLATGAWGDDVPGLYSDLARPATSSHLFIAIDITHFRLLDGFLDEARAAAVRVRNAKRAPGVDRLTTPGERKWEIARANDGTINLAGAQAKALIEMAAEIGVDAGPLAAAVRK